MKKKSTKKTKNTKKKAPEKRKKDQKVINDSSRQRNSNLIIGFVSLFLGILFKVYKDNPNPSQLVGLVIDAISLRFIGILGTELLPLYFILLGSFILITKKSKFESFLYLTLSFQIICLIQFQNLNAFKPLNALTQLGYVGSFLYQNSIILFDHKISRLFWVMTLTLSSVLLFKKPLIVLQETLKFLSLKVKNFIIETNEEIQKNKNKSNFQKKIIHTLFFSKKTIKTERQESFFDNVDFKDSKLAQKPEKNINLPTITATEQDKIFELPPSLANITQPILDNPIDTEIHIENNNIDLSAVKEDLFTETNNKEEVPPINIDTPKIIENKTSKKSSVKDSDTENITINSNTVDEETYQLPPISYLKQSNIKTDSIKNQTKKRVEQAAILEEALLSFNVKAKVINITPGPSVTRFELQPGEGVKISKITGLSKDIALKLAAPDIRIEAPIPGKALIGIEVPNSNIQMITLRSIMQETDFYSKSALSAGMGKTITGECILMDLAKMPHLLMAGATGQGKSVGLNAVLTSLLYKKHPAEVKFVLVDPKKVELTLYNKIERHYLAKLPNSEEAIITDNKKVINTLNSLCIEMDNRYELLKNAACRNIVEYNKKFKSRKLNPNDGHQFLPYIVLVVDEFADLIMTAGKEVETPIARLAQLARAIGIHLIIATQRPSVNVITGVIKANFPARIAFRVTSKIDSRTILDGSGADQLIGRGDMLYTQGNELIRIQCAFVDTPEIEQLTDYIGSQKAYATAHQLPEYVGEEGGTQLDNNIEDRDKLFREAAEVLVIAQQGSASLLQRKLKLGYNRAGRLIDQLEAAGIVGPFEGSKARQVLIPDLQSLDRYFENE